MKGEKEAAAALAHEVKNPLALIRANVDNIKPQIKDSSGRRCIELIYREIDRINSVITGFAARKEETEIIFLEDLLCDVIDEYHISEKDKEVEFVIETTDEDIAVRASYSKLCILFFNVFKNAVEAVGKKGSIVTEIVKDGDFALVTVTDNGCGIDESIAAVIGRPFVSCKEGGMGLGVAICKKIAAEYGGSVTLENAENGGCRVTIRLRCAEE